jgi:hypothetical protein
MSAEKIKRLIETILNEKKGLVVAQVHEIQENIMQQLESIKEIHGFDAFQVPGDLVPPVTDADNLVKSIHEHVMAISASENQLKLISNLLNAINLFSSRSALFLLRDDKLVGWRGKGFDEHDSNVSDKDIKTVFFSLSADTVFRHVLETRKAYSGAPAPRGDDHLIFSRFGGAAPKEIAVLPFFVKGKPQAVIYVDAFEGDPKIGRKEIEIFAKTGEMSLDLLPLRQKILARVKTQEFIGDSEPEPEPDTAADFIPSTKKTKGPSLLSHDPERKARVILNDIILYNQKAVEDGIDSGDLYGALRDTIDQAREEFIRKHNEMDVFETQLVKILAKGNRDVLKGYPFEAI